MYLLGAIDDRDAWMTDAGVVEQTASGDAQTPWGEPKAWAMPCEDGFGLCVPEHALAAVLHLLHERFNRLGVRHVHPAQRRGEVSVQ